MLFCSLDMPVRVIAYLRSRFGGGSLRAPTVEACQAGDTAQQVVNVEFSVVNLGGGFGHPLFLTENFTKCVKVSKSSFLPLTFWQDALNLPSACPLTAWVAFSLHRVAQPQNGRLLPLERMNYRVF